ncbi:MAG: PP2C family protein-serine/threonine phosphatase [Phycisphaerales bacterium]
MSATITAEFREEFELERERFLRKRFFWYAVVVIVIGALGLIANGLPLFNIGVRVSGDDPEQMARTLRLIRLNAASSVTTGLLGVIAYGAALAHTRRHLLPRGKMLRLVAGLILFNGVLALGLSAVITEIGTRLTAEVGDGEVMPRNVAGFIGLWSIFVTHFFACLFLPWTPKESIKPVVPLLVLNAILTLIYASGWVAPVLTITFSPLVAAPGAAIVWWRHSRLHQRVHYGALRRRYGEMRQELTDARRIHEALFPEPVEDGPLRMIYRYQPMRQIGGDYLFSRFSPSPHGPQPRLSVVIVDVTGHGIPAALTVNRLHGELERLFAEDPDASPGEILESLNRYVHLTLATHSVYVTAVCVRVDPNAPFPRSTDAYAKGVIEWASGGHPPAFLRSIDGAIERLDSTTFVLGACHGDDFQHEQQIRPFGPGDALIAYTDGATEARDREGRMLRVEGMQRIVASVHHASDNGCLADAILGAVEQHRFGPPADDTLIVEILRPVSA